MKKRMKMIDVLASVLLVGVVSAIAVAQVGPPTPVTVPCEGFTVYRPIGDPIVVPDWECPEGWECLMVFVVDENNFVIDAWGACLLIV